MPPSQSPSVPSIPSASPSKHWAHWVIIGLLVVSILGLATLLLKTDMAAKKAQKDTAELVARLDRMEEEIKLSEGNEADARLAVEEDWIQSTSKFYTLEYSYPKGFFVERFGGYLNDDTLSVQSSKFTMAINSATGCEPNDICATEGLQITVTDYHPEIENPKLPEKFTYTPTSNPAIKKADISNYCAEADGPCFPPKALYYFAGKQVTYEINVLERNYSGDSMAIIDGFLERLHE